MDRPLYHLPFGPNWFCPQIMSFSANMSKIGFGINDSVHIMNFQNKQPLYDLYPAQNQKLRVTAILLNDDDQTYVAYQNYLAFFNQDQQIWSVEIQFKNIFYIIQQDNLFLIDQNDGILDFKNKSVINKFEGKVKNYFQNENMLILENKIIIYSSNFQEITNQIQIDQKILDSDIQNNLLVILVKEKQKIEVILYDNLQQIKKFEVKFKLSQIDKPSLCIRLYNNNIIITGVKGEIFNIDYNEIQQITLDANNINTSYQGDGEFNIDSQKYKTYLDNPHFKPIYQIYKQNNSLIFLSQDRKISFWQNDKIYYTLDLLTCKYIQLHSYQNQIIALGIALYIQGSDNTIRRWNIKKLDSYYSNNIWKHLNNIKITNICLNQKQDGILAISTDNQLGLYDISAQKLAKLTEAFHQRILSIFWVENIIQLNQNVKIVQQDKSYTKQLSQNQQIFAILETKIIIWNLNYIQQINLNLPHGFILNSCDLYQDDLNIMAFGSKQGRVIFQLFNQKYQECEIIDQKQPISTLKFKYIDNMLLLAIGCFDRSIYILQLFVQENQISFQMLHNFKHKSPVQKLQWSSNFDLLAIGYHNSSIQIWNVDPDMDQQEEVANVRGHRGYVQDAIFLENGRLLSCSDDQSLKVWEISACQHKKQQNKKKKKKIKLDDQLQEKLQEKIEVE